MVEKSTGSLISSRSENPDSRTPTTSSSAFLTTTLVPVATVFSTKIKYRSCASSLVTPTAPFSD
ncbi:hypothetical protein PENTCL1PPCAC_5195 [Pristionchus entomophagus]|uniref:Uncharacterized protein n=1 Tax=Pristionchus entomophagus TaxID=358040 RepID=A0AAV5SI28_9BILA|nr:hypothetical protein PENTCL1PPCAC_5195 [Pristionchus entomophagus]